MKKNYSKPLTEVEHLRLETNFVTSFHDNGSGTPDVSFNYDDDDTFA